MAPGTMLVLVVVCMAQFVVVLDSTIVSVALPSIQRELGFSSAAVSWVINAYALLFGGCLLLGGRCADLFGRRRMLILGTAVFTSASLLAGLSTSPGPLLASRAVQGIGAAMIVPAGLSVLTTTFAEGRERTRAMAISSAIVTSGAASGQLVGGLLTGLASWRWIFFVNIPIGAIVLLLARSRLPSGSGAGERGGFDFGGAATVTAGLIALTAGVVGSQDSGWASARTAGLIGLGIALLLAFLAIERRQRRPLVRLELLRRRSHAIADATMLLMGAGVFAVLFLATFYVQDVLGYTPTESGLAFLPISSGIVAGSFSAHWLIPRIGVRRCLLGGLAASALGIALLTRITPEGDYLSEIFPAFVCLALGLGHIFVPLVLVATTNVPAAFAGLASGLYATCQQIGGALGIALLATLAAQRSGSLASSGASADVSLVGGYRLSFWVALGFVALAFALVALLLRRGDTERADGQAVQEAP